MFGTKKIFKMLKTGPYPIGAYMGEDTLRLVQLDKNENGMSLVNGTSRNRPEDIQHGSAKWQRWCVEIVNGQTCNGSFRGKKIIMAMPASEVFIDHIKMANCETDKLSELAFEKAKQKIPFEADDAVIKCIPTEEDNVIVIATERKKIDRYLAIFEKASLQLHSIDIWPVALVNTYVTFFGRRQTDKETVVMLVDIEETYTNVVICRHSNVLFARSVPIGSRQLEVDEMMSRFVQEVESCRRHFNTATLQQASLYAPVVWEV